MCWSTLVFLSSLFHIACFQHSSMLELVSKLHSFLLLKRYCIVPIYRILFIHSFVDVHFWIVSAFSHWWVKAAMYIDIQVSVWTFVLIILSIYLGVESLRHMAILHLTFWETAELFSKVAALFYVPISNVWGFQFLYTLTWLNWTDYNIEKKASCREICAAWHQFYKV